MMIIKKLLFVFITLAFSLASPMSVLAATLSLSPAAGSFNKGCTFSLNIVLDSGSDQVEGTDVHYLAYDNSRFTVTSIQNGTIFSDYPISNIDQNGKVDVSGVDANNKPFNGQGTFATVNFTVKDTALAGSTQMTFSFVPNSTTDSNVEVIQNNSVIDVLSGVTNGNYIVGSGSCSQVSPSPSSSTTVTSGSTSTLGRGGPVATGSGATKVLPPAGSEQLTATLAIIGGILTMLGILGLVLL